MRKHLEKWLALLIAVCMLSGSIGAAAEEAFPDPAALPEYADILSDAGTDELTEGLTEDASGETGEAEEPGPETDDELPASDPEQESVPEPDGQEPETQPGDDPEEDPASLPEAIPEEQPAEEPVYADPEELTELTAEGPARTQVGLEYALTLTDAGMPVDPARADWSLSDPEIASVTEDGLFTGRKPGYVIVRAEARDGSGLWAEIGITVVPATVVICTDNNRDFSEEVAGTIAEFNLAEPDAMEKAEDDGFELMRLIADLEGPLPDLTAWNPSTVILNGDGTLVIQFSTVAETKAAYQALKEDPALSELSPDAVMSLDSWDVVTEAADFLEDGSGEILEVQERGYSGSYMDSTGMGVLNIPVFAYNASSVSSRVTVAIIDSGIYKSHSVFSGHYESGGYDFLQRKTANGYDPNGHGTHVAGTVIDATRGFNVYVRDYRTQGSDGKGSTLNVLNAVRRAADDGCKVINMSLGGNKTSLNSRFKKACSYAIGKGAVICCSAGNDNKNTARVEPAGFTMAGMVVVSSVYVKSSGGAAKASYSNWGSSVDVCAPGGDKSQNQWVYSASTGSTSGTRAMCGTSQACPHISGLCALIRLYAGVTSPAKIEEYLKSICTDLGAAGRDDYYGCGIPDAVAMLAQYRINSAGITQTGIDEYGRAVSDVRIATGTGVSSVDLCDQDGKEIGTMTSYYTSGSQRIWTVTMTTTFDGDRTYYVYSNGTISSGSSGSISYQSPGYQCKTKLEGTYVWSAEKVTAAPEVKKGSKVKFKVITNRYTPYLHVYDGNGSFVTSFKASKYSKIKDGQRTWTVSCKYNTVGWNQNYRFAGAQASSYGANRYVLSAPAVSVFGGTAVTSVSCKSTTVVSGSSVTVTVKTPKNANRLELYRSASGTTPELTWDPYSASTRISGKNRIWTLNIRFNYENPAYETFWFRCSADNGYTVGLGKGLSLAVAAGSQPVVGALKVSASGIKAGKKLKITLKTSGNADSVRMYVGSRSSADASWSRWNVGPKLSNGDLVWTLYHTFSSYDRGSRDLSFYAYSGSTRGSVYIKTTVKVK